jgi:hypothetical protein
MLTRSEGRLPSPVEVWISHTGGTVSQGKVGELREGALPQIWDSLPLAPRGPFEAHQWPP